MENYYQLGRVYKIINRFDNQIYIGSTFNSLKQRWNIHKYDYKKWLNDIRRKKCYCSSFDLFNKYGIENFKICLIKEYICVRTSIYDLKHLHSKEQLWINKTKNINSICSFNPLKYNKIWIRKYDKRYDKNTTKIYRIKNRNKFRKSIICNCGGKYKYHSKLKHFKTNKHLNWIKNNS